MPRIGLFVKTVALLLAIFGASFVAVRAFYLPWLEGRVRGQMTDVAEDCLNSSEEILRRRARHLGDRLERTVLDLPFELVSDDSERVRGLVLDSTSGLTRAWSGNVALLTREFRSRAEDRIGRRAATLAEEFRGDAFAGLLLLLGTVLALVGFALGRGVLTPLGHLLRATEEIAAGDLETRVGLRGGDEVGRLGRAFDRMTDALGASRAEIESLNRTLEDKVREKTRALIHSEKMASLGTLAGGVAHEFNNLLGGIIGCAEDAAGDDDPEEVRESLDMILRTARRACIITENLLKFSRPPALAPRPANLPDLVREALGLIGPEAAKRGVSVEDDLAEIPAVRIDPGQIHQVVLNLLTNGLHAMDGGGRLRVSVRREDRDALIVVEDTGPGIPEEARGRIFEPFFTTKETGTGLGLSVSYSIVKSHGGTIEAGSTPEGGARFVVRLPLDGEVNG